MVMEVQECILRDQKVSLNNEIKCGKALDVSNITFIVLLIMLLNCITKSPSQVRSRAVVLTVWSPGWQNKHHQKICLKCKLADSLQTYRNPVLTDPPCDSDALSS